MVAAVVRTLCGWSRGAQGRLLTRGKDRGAAGAGGRSRMRRRQLEPRPIHPARPAPALGYGARPRRWFAARQLRSRASWARGGGRPAAAPARRRGGRACPSGTACGAGAGRGREGARAWAAQRRARGRAHGPDRLGQAQANPFGCRTASGTCHTALHQPTSSSPPAQRRGSLQHSAHPPPPPYKQCTRLFESSPRNVLTSSSWAALLSLAMSALFWVEGGGRRCGVGCKGGRQQG